MDSTKSLISLLSVNKEMNIEQLRELISSSTISSAVSIEATEYLELYLNKYGEENFTAGKLISYIFQTNSGKSIMNAANDPNLKKTVETRSFGQLRKLIKKDVPINIYVNGETGLGKSTAVMVIAKEIGMEVIRVNLSYATDVDDLMGGLRLLSAEEGGGTFFQKGPVIEAMQRGAILLLDEVDAANPRILMELQPVLEGRGVLVKKINEMVYPTPGFRVVATGNSKGRGDNTGNYVGVAPLNKAFLDRFDVYVTFSSPSLAEMTAILQSSAKGLEDEMYDCLAEWYNQVRTSITDGNIELSEISTRRMISIANLMKAFNVKFPEDDVCKEAILSGCSIYDESVSNALWNVWDMLIANSAVARKDRRKRAEAQANGVDNEKKGITDYKVDEAGDWIPF